jgi:hypothetical protein
MYGCVQILVLTIQISSIFECIYKHLLFVAD